MEVKDIIKEDRNKIIPSYEYRDYFRKDGSRRYNSHREANWYKIGILDCFDNIERVLYNVLGGYIIRDFHSGESYSIDKLAKDIRKAMEE